MSNNYNMENARQTFFIESREMLDEMERCLLELEKNNDDEEIINALFRSVHTIKGSSGMFGYHDIEKFTHVVENVLDKLRNGDIEIDSSLSALLFKSHDYISELFDLHTSDEENEITSEMKERMDSLIAGLHVYSGKNKEESAAFKEQPEEKDEKQETRGNGKDYWHISLRFNENVFRDSLDPYPFISYLGEIGKIVQIKTIFDEISEDKEMDPENCYLGFEISFHGDVSKSTIEDVFDFVKEDCEIRILPPDSSAEKYIELINDMPRMSERIGEMLVSIGSITEKELEQALKMQKLQSASDGPDKKLLLGDILVNNNLVHKKVIDAALNKQNDLKKIDKKNLNLLRVNAEKINELINLIGEFVIKGSNVRQLVEKTGDGELIESVSDMTRLIEDIRDNTMSIRMVPIGDTFNRYQRVVRDLSREKGKEIELVIAGGDTELDKTLIDKISDPLIHLVRNAVDHGIGTPEERITKGKPRVGTIYLNAYNEMGSVVIVASDDGNGLDRDSIYNKAVELEFIQPGETISDNDLFQLIFEPGFSTAKEVSNISGRGVGMDVVKRNIEALQGSITLESTKGEGTAIKIHLPLTLAIIDGFMVQVGGYYYVIPQDMVVECSDISPEHMKVKEGGNFISLRGNVLPYMRMRDFFDLTDKKPERENIIVVEYASKIAGIVVDRPEGEVQAVIKPLGRIFGQLKWISGATILGNGDVALILDIPKLIQLIENKAGYKTENSVGIVQ
ncbi:MAG: chemotaxis protein CheA [Spirochaetes bacterium]|nr:chemotaxis protein CheA [Spirochaetota bacterium]